MKDFEKINRTDWETICPITNNTLSVIPFDKIAFFLLASEGAMGEPGRISLFEVKDSKLIHYRGSRYEYRADQNKYVFSELTHEMIKDSLKYHSDCWVEVYLGQGNILYVRKNFYPTFQEITDELSPAKIFVLLPEIIMEVLRTYHKN